ncbi:alpha/beta hydrolase [Spiroplasma taiwanense]|uniref:Putative hydrolase n=1 Tax=Spiroplasma taiwanense CT-1 TaxID=1276220 RepID=S5MC95_9MOLU|nr:alpha/beta hydrolase [Spiroplasma taiwanense]AGR41353.1 putative hydrolase [Spiroplasma taiwanense CT-1]
MSKKIKLYTYNFLKIILSTILFPIIFIKSNKLFKLYKYFCYTYPRFGKYEGPNGEFNHIPVEVNTLEYHYWDIDKMNLGKDSFKKQDLFEFDITTDKGNISCLKALNGNSKKWVIGMHGWTEDKYLALRLVNHFYKNGYNILTFDAFAHGKSYGQNTDIGYSSISMIDQIIDNLKKEYQVENIGLIGNSMGASTSILYSQTGKFKDDISWVVADCGFSSIKLQYRYYIQNNFFKKPWWIVGMGYTKKFSKLTKTNQSKYDLLKLMNLNKEIPILFIHAIGDTFIPYEMSLDMYNKKIKFESNTLSEIWTPEGSNHVYVITDYNEQYLDRTLNFANEREKKVNEN